MIVQNMSNTTAQSVQPVRVASSAQGEAGVAVSEAKLSPVTVGPSEATRAAPQPVTAEALKNAVSVMNQVMRQVNSSLQFTMDSSTSAPIVRLVDTDTGELIRQIPSEETLAISRSIDRVLQQQNLPCNQGVLCKQVA